ncbi:hypothetical protein CDEN61S_00456 [Castellaniella denitrificans]
MSERLSLTAITSEDSRLKAATATIRVRIRNIMRFSVCTAANQVRLFWVQSVARTPAGIRPSKAWATWGARCMSAMRRRTPLTPLSRNTRAASCTSMNTSEASYS